MRVIQTIACGILAALIALLGFVWMGAGASRAASEVRQPIAIQLSLDRPLDAGAAPFVMASARGLFSAEGLAVTIYTVTGSPAAIARVAEGSSDFAVVDIN